MGNLCQSDAARHIGPAAFEDTRLPSAIDRNTTEWINAITARLELVRTANSFMAASAQVEHGSSYHRWAVTRITMNGERWPATAKMWLWRMDPRVFAVFPLQSLRRLLCDLCGSRFQELRARCRSYGYGPSEQSRFTF